MSRFLNGCGRSGDGEGRERWLGGKLTFHVAPDARGAYPDLVRHSDDSYWVRLDRRKCQLASSAHAASVEEDADGGGLAREHGHPCRGTVFTTGHVRSPSCRMRPGAYQTEADSSSLPRPTQLDEIKNLYAEVRFVSLRPIVSVHYTPTDVPTPQRRVVDLVASPPPNSPKKYPVLALLNRAVATRRCPDRLPHQLFLQLSEDPLVEALWRNAPLRLDNCGRH